MPPSPAYASFLVRLWREGDTERGTPAAGWQGEVQHIQTSQRWTFSTLDELLSFLRRQAEDLDALGWPTGE
jgi:hypothetical protein